MCIYYEEILCCPLTKWTVFCPYILWMSIFLLSTSLSPAFILCLMLCRWFCKSHIQKFSGRRTYQSRTRTWKYSTLLQLTGLSHTKIEYFCNCTIWFEALGLEYFINSSSSLMAKCHMYVDGLQYVYIFPQNSIKII